MPTNDAQRIWRLECLFKPLKKLVDRLAADVGNLKQQQFAPSLGQGGGGGGQAVYMAIAPTGGFTAGGPPPGGVPSHVDNVQIYQLASGGYTPLALARIWNAMPNAIAAGKVLMVDPDGTGTYVIKAVSC